ncbi:MAG: M48 family metalloprotease [Candidatus Omnitrophota bacterium]|nr:M48 family metalloprotease [Candidatus Omnitrophota bacterium]
MAQRLLALLLAFTLTTAGCVSGGGGREADVSRGLGLSSDEIKVGEKIHAEIISQFYLYTEPSVVDYVEAIKEAVAAQAGRQSFPYRLTLLHHEKIYATSAPGGYLYVTTGMLNFLQNDAELAAVLAHEIGQLQIRDPRLSVGRKMLQTLTRTGAFAAPLFGQFGALAALGLIMLNGVAEAKTFDAEQKLLLADEKALTYMVDAGYDPQGLPDVLYNFLHADKRIIPFFYDYYQSRPITELRMLSVNKVFSELPLADKTFTVNRENYLEAMKGVFEIYR